MGKDLKGKELGSGISQRKDGYYIGRYTTRDGKRVQKIFRKLQECRKWVADSQYLESHSNIDFPVNMLVSEWYKYWIAVKEKTVRLNTLDNYIDRYRMNIEPVLGQKLLRDVSTIDCQRVLNRMADEGYKNTSIMQAKATLHNMLDYAYQNNVLSKNPCTKVVQYNIGEKSSNREALSIDEQRKILKAISGNKYEKQYRFALQTGLRAGELIGLEWKDVDFGNKTISVKRTCRYKYKLKEWLIGDPKSKNGKRTIPLTEEAFEILKEQKKIDNGLKVLEFKWKDTVFLRLDGKPANNTELDIELYTVCKKNGLSKISMHILRHTFATRCAEAGMIPKTLQMILGHSNITTTMNIYVHATEDQKKKEMNMVEEALRVV